MIGRIFDVYGPRLAWVAICLAVMLWGYGLWAFGL